ncbi:MAG: hypothetical protein IT267_00440 [Saprospiraceae bacterium]|nr:hypothetical protein [Saprospiraceae bacterium]
MRVSIIFFILLISCKEDLQRELRTAAYPIVDSIYKRQMNQITKEADSMCIQITHAKLQSVIDSILEVRRNQVKQLRSFE